MNKESLETIYEAQQARFMEEWKTLLKFESISTDPAYNQQCVDCADWLVSHLTGMGLHVELLQTTGKPVVYATYQGKADHPTVIFYGHYDVQPVDPVEDWETPPFAPTLRDGRLYARGAQDNKGQAFYVLKAIETLIQHNALNCSLKLFLEGEEECGSKGITKALPGWTDKLKGDVLMVCDTGAVGPGIPTVTMGLRGVLHLEFHLEGISHDLHSGSHGGMVKNPALEMARLLATLHDDNGRIAVEGFYDGVDEIHPEDRRLANAAPFDANTYEAQIGVPPLGGELDFTPVERKGFRPTIEVNGLHSGYGGPGGKTIIPAHAVAKLSARLVGKQDPQHALDCILRHVKAHAPKGLQFRIEDASVGGPAVLLSSQSEIIQQARQVLEQIATEPPVFSWEGGSIPVVASLAEAAGAAPLLVGFGLEEDRIHAPNESFALSQFKLGYLYAALMLHSL